MNDTALKYYQMGLAVARLLRAGESLNEVFSSEKWLEDDPTVGPELDEAIEAIDRLIRKALDRVR